MYQKSIHHSFDIHLAEEYGVNEAILIHHFQHWIQFNMKTKKNQHEGRTWSYQTLEDIAAHFPYWSKDQIVTLIDKLCAGKTRFQKEKSFEPVLMKGNFNKHNYDRTVWYAFVNEEKFTILCKHKMEIGETQNGDWGNTTPIPHTKTDAKTKIPPGHDDEKNIFQFDEKKAILSKLDMNEEDLKQVASHYNLDTLENAVTFIISSKAKTTGTIRGRIVDCIKGRYWENPDHKAVVAGAKLFHSFKTALESFRGNNKIKMGIESTDDRIIVQSSIIGSWEYTPKDFEDLDRVKTILNSFNETFSSTHKLVHDTLRGNYRIISVR